MSLYENILGAFDNFADDGVAAKQVTKNLRLLTIPVLCFEKNHVRMQHAIVSPFISEYGMKTLMGLDDDDYIAGPLQPSQFGGDVQLVVTGTSHITDDEVETPYSALEREIGEETGLTGFMSNGVMTVTNAFVPSPKKRGEVDLKNGKVEGVVKFNDGVSAIMLLSAVDLGENGDDVRGVCLMRMSEVKSAIKLLRPSLLALKNIFFGQDGAADYAVNEAFGVIDNHKRTGWVAVHKREDRYKLNVFRSCGLQRKGWIKIR